MVIYDLFSKLLPSHHKVDSTMFSLSSADHVSDEVINFNPLPDYLARYFPTEPYPTCA